MKNLIFAFCVLFAIIQIGQSIRCYQCVSKGCTTTTNCSSSFDACSFTHTKLGNKFALACSKKSACDLAKSGCEKTKLCATKCCQTDLCNSDGPLTPGSGASTIISSKAFFAVPLVVLILSYL